MSPSASDPQLASHRALRRLLFASISLLAALVLAGPALAQRPDRGGTSRQGTAAKERSRDRGQTNPAAGPTTTGPATDRAAREPLDTSADLGSRSAADRAAEPNPAQQANLQQLRDDLGNLANGAQSASSEIQNLAHSLQGMGLQAPDQALTQELATSLAHAVEDSNLSPKEIAQLTQAVYAVLDSAGLDQGEMQQIQNDVEAILIAAGVDRSDVQAVLDDLEAIYQASNAGGGQSSTGRDEERTKTRRGRFG